MEKNLQIEPNETYNITQISRLKLPGMKTYSTLLIKVFEDSMLPASQRVLNATKVGDGKGRKYFVLGRNLLKFIEAQRRSK